MELSGKQKRFLRGRGHSLKPLVQVGKNGVGEALIRQMDESLNAFELVKVKMLETCPLNRDECAEALIKATGGALAQTMGKTMLIYRAHPDDPQLHLPG